MNCKLKLKVK